MKKILALIVLLIFASGLYVTDAQRIETITKVKVQYGDTIWDIAKRETPPGEDIRNTVSRIKRDNGITDGTTLQPGDILEIRK